LKEKLGGIELPGFSLIIKVLLDFTAYRILELIAFYSAQKPGFGKRLCQ